MKVHPRRCCNHLHPFHPVLFSSCPLLIFERHLDHVTAAKPLPRTRILSRFHHFPQTAHRDAGADVSCLSRVEFADEWKGFAEWCWIKPSMLTALQSHGHGDMSVMLYVMNILLWEVTCLQDDVTLSVLTQFASAHKFNGGSREL